MSSESDNKSVLRLSNPNGTTPKGHAALGNSSTEEEIVGRSLLADQQQRIRELERNIADLQALELQQQAARGKYSSGKSRHVAHAQGWKAICTEPDYCKVGKDIVAFNSFASLDHKELASKNVRARGTSTYRKGDVLIKVNGDAGKHIVSGTSLDRGHVKILEGHESVRVNGLQAARHDSRCLINCDSEGIGGARGKLVTAEKTKTASAADDSSNGEAESTQLELLNSYHSALQSSQIEFDSTDKYVNFQVTDKSITQLIDSMHFVPGVASEKLQMIRGVLGFTKDFVLGIGQATYEALKSLPKVAQRSLTTNGRVLTGIEAQIFVENLRGENISISAIKQTGLQIVAELVEPVTDPWSRGQHVEAVTRGLAEAATVGFSWRKLAPIARNYRKSLNAGSYTEGGVHVTSRSIRERVLFNLNRSRAATVSSNFDDFIAAEGRVQERSNIWPPNRGRMGRVEVVEIPPGEKLDRYGLSHGSFVAPTGTPFEARALPSSYLKSVPYHQYEVIRAMPNATKSKALPWFGKKGMGTQFELEHSVQWYLDNNFIRKI